MIRKILFYVVQFVFIIAIVFLLLWVSKETFELQSPTQRTLAVAVITTIVSIVCSAGVINIKKLIRQVKLKNTCWKEAEEINFGIDGYAFYDHDDCGYRNDLITACLSESTYVYDFNKSFSENANVFAKLRMIQDFVSDKFSQENLDDVVANLIEEVEIDKLSDNPSVLLVQSLTKNRQDVNANRLEATVLHIDLIGSDYKTKKLIDAIYNYLRRKYPDIMDASYKTNEKYKLKKNFIDDFVCFATTLSLYGCILKKEGGNLDDAGYYLHKLSKPGANIITLSKEDLFPNGCKDKVNGEKILSIPMDYKQSLPVSDYDSSYITDVVFANTDGLLCYLLYTVQPTESVKGNDAFFLMYANKRLSQLFLYIASLDRSPWYQFYLSYARSVVRKHENKRFKK